MLKGCANFLIILFFSYTHEVVKVYKFFLVMYFASSLNKSMSVSKQVCLRPVRKGGGGSIMNIHYDVTGLLTVVWRSHSGQIVWPAGVGQGRGGF